MLIGLKTTQPAGESANMQNRRTGMIAVGAGSVQGFFFQAGITNARHGWGKGGHFSPDFTGVMITHRIPHAGYHFTDSFPVALTRERFYRLANPLRPALRISKGTVFFGKAGPRRNLTPQRNQDRF